MFRFLLLMMLFGRACAFEYELSIAAIFQNEAPYLREWIEYHRIQGVEHFLLYNNNSTDNFQQVLDPYICQGVVELIHWPHVQKEKDFTNFCFDVQPKAYMNAIDRSRNTTKWLALIDIDEYLYPIEHESISECLKKEFDKEVGVYIHWLNFGHSYVDKVLPKELLIEKLIMCATAGDERNTFRKSIVKPIHVKTCINPHLCEYNSGQHRQDKKVDKYLRINHYWSRDLWYLENIKISRYDNWGVNAEAIRGIANRTSVEFNLDIQRFVPRLEEAMR